MKQFKRILWVLLSLILVLLLAGGGFVTWLWVKEYRPEPIEPARIVQSPNPTPVEVGQDLTLVSYNIGYAGLGENQDFFLDGGRQVQPDTAEDVRTNLYGIADELEKMQADFYFLQEVDESAKRSYGFNEVDFLARRLDLGYSFTYNFKVPYVPYPVPPIGPVASGLMTLTAAHLTDANRHSLPVPFKWPVRLANLKRGLLVTRHPLKHSAVAGGTEPELVLVNLHLEAYDDGAGKVAQTQALRAFLEAEYAKGNYVIAGGDWNQILPGTAETPLQPDLAWKPGSLSAEDLPKGWTLAVDPKRATDRLTNRPYAGNEQPQLFAIDGFLLSPNVSLTQVQALDTQFRYSDHLPIYLQFKLKPSKTDPKPVQRADTRP